MTKRNRGRAGTGIRLAVLSGLGVIVLFLSVSLGTVIGSVQIPPEVVFGVVANKIIPGLVEPNWTTGQEAIIWSIRLPRCMLACIVGAGLAMVGSSLQAVTRNPLADPHLLGISSGGAFGAVLALLHTGMFLGQLTVPLMSFLGALAATATVLTVSRLAEATTATRLVLAGVAVSFAIMSCTNLLIFLGDPRAAHSAVFWMLGGLGLARWVDLPIPGLVLLACLVHFRLRSGELNAVTLGDETAATLGIAVSRFRMSIFVTGALLTGSLVAYSGIIGFLGLMIPHIVRMMVGGDNARVIPASALAGAIFLVWADIAARTLAAPEDMPIGIVTGLIGGAFFVWLLRRRSL